MSFCGTRGHDDCEGKVATNYRGNRKLASVHSGSRKLASVHSADNSNLFLGFNAVIENQTLFRASGEHALQSARPVGPSSAFNTDLRNAFLSTLSFQTEPFSGRQFSNSGCDSNGVQNDQTQSDHLARRLYDHHAYYDLCSHFGSRCFRSTS